MILLTGAHTGAYLDQCKKYAFIAAYFGIAPAPSALWPDVRVSRTNDDELLAPINL